MTNDRFKNCRCVPYCQCNRPAEDRPSRTRRMGGDILREGGTISDVLKAANPLTTGDASLSQRDLIAIAEAIVNPPEPTAAMVEVSERFLRDYGTAGDAEPQECNCSGGNDYLACSTCHVEYDYRKEPRPPCPRIATTEPQPFEMPDGRPIFGEGSPHDIGEHLKQVCAEPQEGVVNLIKAMQTAHLMSHEDFCDSSYWKDEFEMAADLALAAAHPLDEECRRLRFALVRIKDCSSDKGSIEVATQALSYSMEGKTDE